jgi:hypothetical protein
MTPTPNPAPEKWLKTGKTEIEDDKHVGRFVTCSSSLTGSFRCPIWNI